MLRVGHSKLAFRAQTAQARRSTGPNFERHSLAHAQHAVDLLDAKPVQDVGHEGLEAHVLDAGNVLRPLEILGRAVLAALPGVVDN